MSRLHAPTCPMCTGQGVLLGSLGLRTWFRCRQCGWDFSRVRRPRHPAAKAAPSQERQP